MTTICGFQGSAKVEIQYMVPALDKIQILKNSIFSINQHLKREVYMVAEMKKDVNLLVRVEDSTTFSNNVLFEIFRYKIY